MKKPLKCPTCTETPLAMTNRQGIEIDYCPQSLVGSVIGWAVPFMWVLWGLGVVLVLGLAFGAHLLLGPSQPADAQGV